jgi:uracil-DNA glycosylase
MSTGIDPLLARIRACRLCVETPRGTPLPHAPRPVLRAAPTARVLVAGQAPGTRVHASGKPFTDPSGERLRAWMGVREDVFYDEALVAIVPMGFCFPGLDAKGGDLPPRPECVATWHDALMPLLPEVRLVLAIGAHAQGYHVRRLGLAPLAGATLTETVASWRALHAAREAPRVIPLPHPSWRNSAWLKRNPWFEAELLPVLRAEVAEAVSR